MPPAPTLQNDSFREAVEILKERMSDCRARSFTPEQRAVLCRSLVDCGYPDRPNSRSIFFSLLFSAAIKEQPSLPDAWLRDVRHELDDLSRGIIRESSFSLRL